MAGDALELGAQLNLLGWRQGSIIAEAELEQLGYAGRYCAVVLSQDCDVVHRADQEPHVEVVLGARTESPRPDRLHGRNPRELDLGVVVEGTESHACFRIQDRVLIEKRNLVQFRPSPVVVIPRDSLRTLIAWVTKRYTRAAFPDAFNARLDRVDHRLERLFKSDESAPVTCIYLILATGEQELPPEQDYIVAVWLTVKVETLSSAAEYAKAQHFETRLKGILDDCVGIQVREMDLKSEAEVSLSDLRFLKRFDRDYRSLAGKFDSAMPPQGV